MTTDEADAALQKAIQDHAIAWELADDSFLLGDWIVVSAWTPIVYDGTTRYTTQMESNSKPDHICKGLLHVALDELVTGDDVE